MADPVIQSNEIFKLVRSISDSQWEDPNPVINVRDLCNMAIAAAIQGKYMMVYKFPNGVTTALNAAQQGQPTNMPKRLMQKWQTSIQLVFETFEKSSFKIEQARVDENGLGFKISWTETPEELAAVKEEATKVLEDLIDSGDVSLSTLEGTTALEKSDIEFKDNITPEK